MIRILLPSLVVASGAVAAHAGPSDWTVVEQMLAAQNPCAALKTRQFGQSIGINQLEDITLRQADAALRDDDVRLSFTGRLACQTPPGALLTGDASAAVTAEAALSLADCSVTSLTVQLSDFGGTFAPILEAIAPALQQAMTDAARPQLVKGCHSFRGDKS